MSSLLTEILISLVVIAIIGGIIGWLVRGAHMNTREVDLDEGLRERQAELEEAYAKIHKLEASMKQINQLRRSEREKLEQRVRELEPLFDIVEKRDARIRELTEQLKIAQEASQAELDKLQLDLNTRQLLGDDDSEVSRLQNDLRLANRQRESAINRYQNQMRQIEDLENVVKEKERLVAELNQRLEEHRTTIESEHAEERREIESLRKQVAEKKEEIGILENKKQYEISLLQARAEKAEQRVESLRDQIQDTQELKNEFLTRENELRQELSTLRSELSDKETEIVKLEKLARSKPPARPTAIHAVASRESATSIPSDNPNSLQALRGIGPTTEIKLKNVGIENLVQMATLKEEDIERICEKMPSFAAQLKRYDWVETAKRLTGASSAGHATQQST